MSDVRWRGMPGHFIDAMNCCFHLCSEVNGYRISTIGCYHPGLEREGEAQEIGFQRKYETFVFRLDYHGSVVNWSEIDTDGYQTEEAAEAGHMLMLAKYVVLAQQAIGGPMTLICLHEGCSEESFGMGVDGRLLCRRHAAHAALRVLAEIAQSPRGRQAVKEVRDWLGHVELEWAVALEKVEIGARVNREFAELGRQIRSLDKALR